MPRHLLLYTRTHKYPMRLLLPALLLFLAHQLAQKVLHLHVAWADDFLDPMLCMPILMGGFLYEQRRWLGRQRFSLFEILAITAFLSVVFECLFPIWSSGFTADWRDVVCYFAGALLFFLFQ